MSWEEYYSGGLPEPGDVVYDDDLDELLYVRQVEWDIDGARLWFWPEGRESRMFAPWMELVQDRREGSGGVL